MLEAASPYRPLLAVIGATALTARAWRKKSLSVDGCCTAWLVGLFAGLAGPWHFSVLLAFFASSTFVTKLGAKRKKAMDPLYVPSGNRNMWQVLCNGGTSTVLLAAYVAGWIPDTPALHYAVLAHYACCQGDTWSSEIGVLTKATPRLIVGFRKVPTGTNGGVTLLGFLGALAGGALLGAVATAVSTGLGTATGTSEVGIIAVSIGGALIGSAIDSIFGQFLQRSAFDQYGRVVEFPPPRTSKTSSALSVDIGSDILSNNAVNFISALITTGIAYWIFQRQV